MTAAAFKPLPESRTAERRRHARVKVCLSGQFMRENREEYPCATLDISPGGVALQSDAPVEIGEKIIAYVSQIGRLQGVVRRQFPGGFAISMTLPTLKREKLADQLTWLGSRQQLGLPEDRRHDRIVPRNLYTTLVLPTGREILCKIIDISRSGAALGVTVDVNVGALVTVGATRCQVVRLFPGGVAVEFGRIIPDDEFNEDYRL